MKHKLCNKRNNLRPGFTTGTAAALAAKACSHMFLTKTKINNISIITPAGIKVESSVQKQVIRNSYVSCSIIKDAGDDPDVTNGIEIFCKLQPNNTQQVQIIGGEGIGTVTKKGLSTPVGEKAINPIPKKMIIHAVKSVLKETGVDVEISIPQGKELAQHTFNPKLGIVNGLSIIGTTGIVKPMSDKAIIDSISLELKVLREESEQVILTFGNYGRRFMKENYNFPENQLVTMSNYCGDILRHAIDLKFKKIIITGHLGKIIKLSGGIFNTHSQVSNAGIELLSLHYGLFSQNISLMKKVYSCNTTEEATDYIIDQGFYKYLANLILRKCSQKFHCSPGLLKIIIFTQTKGYLGESS